MKKKINHPVNNIPKYLKHDCNLIKFKCKHCNQLNELPITSYTTIECDFCNKELSIYEPLKIVHINNGIYASLGYYTIDQFTN